MSRINRKFLKGPDTFQREATQTARWLAGRWPAAVGVLVAVIGLVAGGAFWQAHSAKREAAAAARLLAAVRRLDEADPAGRPAAEPARAAADALMLFREVATTYQGTDAGATAQLYVAHALLRSGDPKGAEPVYAAALAVAPHDLGREAARYGLGHAKLARGDAEGAVETWRPLTERPGPYRGLAWLDIARAEEARGRGEEARKAYAAGRTLVREGTRIAALVDERLAALGGAPADAPPAGGETPAAR